MLTKIHHGRPMSNFLEKAVETVFPGRKASVSPTKTLGRAGVAVHGGYLEENERSAEVSGTTKYRTYSDLISNISIVAAGVRYYLNLASNSAWSFSPSEADVDKKYAKLAEAALTDDPKTPWHRVIRRACMYRFYGFSVQEWTMRRHEDGHLTFDDISTRAQRTIVRWDVDQYGNVLGMDQEHPQTNQPVYLPRGKVLYVVDDAINDSPEGLGLFRNLVESARRLQRYQQLEGYGFEMDLRGVPVGRGPFSELERMVADGEIDAATRTAIEKPLRDFISKRLKNPELGILIDSQPYTSTDDATKPSSMRQWDLELLSAEVGTQKEVAAAIQRVMHEMAVVMGVENLLVGSSGEGSLALSKDKSQNFFLTVDGALKEVRSAVQKDLIDALWLANGWPNEMKPTAKTEAVRFKDVQQITSALKDMATSGSILMPDDPAIGEVRDLLGLSRPDPASQLALDEPTGQEPAQADDDDATGDAAALQGGPQLAARERRRRQLRPNTGPLTGPAEEVLV